MNLETESSIKPIKIQLSCRDEIIDVPMYCIKKIPLLESIEESKSNEIVTLDSMSPRFLRLIVDYCKNDQKSAYLKKVLTDEFDDDIIKIYLKYLGMNIVFDELYPPPVPPLPPSLNDDDLSDTIIRNGYYSPHRYQRKNSSDSDSDCCKKSTKKKSTKKKSTKKTKGFRGLPGMCSGTGKRCSRKK